MRHQKAPLILLVPLIFGCATLALAQVSAQSGATYAKAMAALDAKRYQEAATLFDQAETESPAQSDALLQAAKAYIRFQSHEAAEKELRQYLENNPHSADALYLLGYILNRRDKPKESLEFYTKAAGISAPTGDDLKVVALDYELLNDNADAIHWLEVAVEKDPSNKEAWYFLGRAYYTASRLPAAQKAFEQALQLDPRDAKAENNMGLIFESDGKPDQALGAYQNAIAWQSADAASREQPYLNLGSLLITLERTKEAVPPLLQAVAIAPGNAQCHLRLGTAYLHLNRLAEAEKELKEAVRLAPDDAAAHYQLGRCYKQAKKMDAAKSEFERVSEIQSGIVEKLKSPPQ